MGRQGGNRLRRREDEAPEKLALRRESNAKNVSGSALGSLRFRLVIKVSRLEGERADFETGEKIVNCIERARIGWRRGRMETQRGRM